MLIRRLIVATALITLGPAAQVRAQDSNWLEPTPFLESTDIFYEIKYGSVGRDGRYDPGAPDQPVNYLFEAGVFPHFIVAFGSRCRETPTGELSGALPCISVTPVVRLRMLDRDSAPVPAPSFMPRVNFQWVYRQGDDKLWNFYAQIGHHSNGQSGCLFQWASTEHQNAICDEYKNDQDSASQLVRDYFQRSDRRTSSEHSERRYIEAHKFTGNFSVNYVKVGVDWAIHNTSSISWRLGASYEHSPDFLAMDRLLREFYPGKRLDVVAGVSFRKPCKRWDMFFEHRRDLSRERLDLVGARFPITGQAICMISEEAGFGVVFRYYQGYDYYNASFLDDVKRFHIGVTINRVKAFGLG